jgi:secreted trypsin-like serine protease
MTKRLLSTAAALIAGVALTLASPGAASANPTGGGGMQPQIVGGDPATETYPFHVAELFKVNPRIHCGGAVIAPQWIVTAGHCLTGRAGNSDPANWTFHIGSNDLLGGEVMDAEKFFVNPNYNGISADIGLIKLATPTSAPAIANYRPPIPGTTVREIGFGYTTTDPDTGPTTAPDNLQQLDTLLNPPSECMFGDEWSWTPGDVCVSRGKGDTASPCNGDSGSPLLVKVNGQWRIIGVDSRSSGDFCVDTDEVYTSTNAYWDWVKATMTANSD